MFLNNRNLSFLLLFLFFAGGEAQAQFRPLLYANRGMVPSEYITPQWYHAGNYMGIPFSGDNQIMLNYNGLVPADLFLSDGVDFNVKWMRALDRLSSRQGAFFHSFQQMFYFSRERFPLHWKGGINHQTRAYAFYPVSLGKFALYGNKNFTDPVDLSEINYSLTSFYTFWIGFTKKLSSDTRFGMHFKLYNAQLHASSQYNGGKIYSEKGENNYYRHRLEDVKISVYSSGFERLPGQYKNVSTIGQFIGRGLKTYYGITSNWGLGIDLGYTQKFNNRWQWDISLLDAGFILYTDDILKAYARGSYAYEGVDVVFPENPIDYWEEIKKDFNAHVKNYYTDKGVFLKTNEFQVYSALTYYYASSEKKKYYSCWNPLRDEDEVPAPSVGLITYYQYLHPKPYWGTAFFWQFHLFPWWRMRAAYSFDSYVNNNLGIWSQWRLGQRVYLFMTMDNLLALKDLSTDQGHRLGFGLYLRL